jgi:hypothetical protein
MVPAVRRPDCETEQPSEVKNAGRLALFILACLRGLVLGQRVTLPSIVKFTLGEEYRLRVFENRVLRRIFGPKREEDGSWRKLHNDELHSLYYSRILLG